MTDIIPCARCGSTEPADDTGLCSVPTCRSFRAGNSLASVHDGRAKFSPADLDARDALMERLFAERGGRNALDVVSQLRIEDFATASIQLAKVHRRLEIRGAVSAAGNARASLVSTYTTFSARVERLAQELPPIVRTSASRSLGPQPSLSEIADRAQALIDSIRAMATVAPEPEMQAAVMSKPVARAPKTEEKTAPAPVVPEPPAPKPLCFYCGNVPCVGEDSPLFLTLHNTDPKEAARVNRAATDLMLHSHGHHPIHLPGRKNEDTL
jgi:hypothetical protein